MKLVSLVLLSALTWGSHTALAFDDAETLSVRVPRQRYAFTGQWSHLRKEDAVWSIPIWSCDPATLTIHTTNLKTAPYAVRVVTGHRNPIRNWSTDRTVDAIHLLAMSKDDALRMRKALITEIAIAQYWIEKRQGNRPGFLKEKAKARK